MISIAALGGVLALVLVALVETAFQYAPTRLLIWLWMALPLTCVARPSERTIRFRGARWLLALAVVGILTWDAGRTVLSCYLTERGYREEFVGDLAKAAADDRRAVEIDPLNREARFHLARAQWKAGDVAGVLRTIDDAVLWDAHPRVYSMRIRVLYRSGQLPQALHRTAEAIRIFPWWPEFEDWRQAIESRMMTAGTPALPPGRRQP
jgi:tetratricopeptide (TPR) repeat protein